MKLTASVQLKTDAGTFAALNDTLHEANRCCNWLSGRAWETKTFAQFKLHKQSYAEAREKFPSLSSQVIVRCIAKVADSYKLDKESKRTYRLTGSIAYDLRILSWKIEKQIVSIWTTSGRLKIPFVCGERQKALLRSQQGESDLVLRNKAFYLAATCSLDDPTPEDIDGILGCDLGVNNILTDSTGKRHSGSHVKSIRHRHKRLRAKLQKKGTKSAKRRLKKLSGKEFRFARDTNHRISKEIVAFAKRTKQGIALEDLKGIRLRIRAGRKQRGVLHSWSFSQLRLFVTYKAKQDGVPVVYVDPRNTSRTCFECGHIAKENRPNQSTFRCVLCGHTAHADINAAKNIGRAAFVNQPNVANCEFKAHGLATSRLLLAGGS